MPAHELMGWLRTSGWHYAIRIPCDVLLHGAKRYPTAVGSLYPPLGEACLYRRVGLWTDGTHRSNLVLATVKGAKESWAVITDEAPRQADLMAICLEISSRGVVNGIANQGHLNWRTRGYAQVMLWSDYIWWQPWLYSMPPPRA